MDSLWLNGQPSITCSLFSLSLFSLFSIALCFSWSIIFQTLPKSYSMSALPPWSCFRGTHDISSERVKDIIQEKLSTVRIPVSEWRDSGCLLADMGDYLLRATHHLSQLADALVNGHHVDIYIKQRVEDTEQENDFSDLDILQYLDSKHNSLKSVRFYPKYLTGLLN